MKNINISSLASLAIALSFAGRVVAQSPTADKLTPDLPPLPKGYISAPMVGIEGAGGGNASPSPSPIVGAPATTPASSNTSRASIADASVANAPGGAVAGVNPSQVNGPKQDKTAFPEATKTSGSGSQKVDMKGVKVNFGDGVSGYRLKNQPVNDLFQYLARLAGRQYFQSPGLNGITISGQMMDGDPIRRMQEVAFQYGISLYEKGDTIYAVPASEVGNMPVKQAEFKLRYLRSDKGKLKELLTPYLTKGSGSIEFEDKTNMLIVQDNEPAIARIRELLARVDVPQRQVTVQVRIFRINMGSDRHVGVSWDQTLGKNGLNVTATAVATMSDVFGGSITKTILNSLANANGVTSSTNSVSWGGETTYTPFPSGKADLTFSPIAVTAVLRALYNNANAETESSPTIITEDNEVAVFSNLDKIPIVTVSSSTSTGGTVNAPEVRYQPDPENPFDIGLKLTVKPTVLPNNNIRLKITPTIGTVTGEVTASGTVNKYPRCDVSSIDNIATIPNGYTVVFGGFTQYSAAKTADKVPILGDVPGLGFFFSSKGNTKVRVNLVFFVTATANMPDSGEAVRESERIRRYLVTDPKAQFADDEHLGVNAEPNLAQSLKEELTPFSKKQKSQSPLSSENPDNVGVPRIKTPQEEMQAKMISTFPQATPTPTKRKAKPWEAIIPARQNNAEAN